LKNVIDDKSFRRGFSSLPPQYPIHLHALSQVARELKKPCIIGTKIATQVLHDGDLVEVDADNGVVRILERKRLI
jgi:hypothetical protein